MILCIQHWSALLEMKFDQYWQGSRQSNLDKRRGYNVETHCIHSSYRYFMQSIYLYVWNWGVSMHSKQIVAANHHKCYETHAFNR